MRTLFLACWMQTDEWSSFKYATYPLRQSLSASPNGSWFMQDKPYLSWCKGWVISSQLYPTSRPLPYSGCQPHKQKRRNPAGTGPGQAPLSHGSRNGECWVCGVTSANLLYNALCMYVQTYFVIKYACSPTRLCPLNAKNHVTNRSLCSVCNFFISNASEENVEECFVLQTFYTVLNWLCTCRP